MIHYYRRVYSTILIYCNSSAFKYRFKNSKLGEFNFKDLLRLKPKQNHQKHSQTFIMANMDTMSQMPEYFPEPLLYRPERWLRDKKHRKLACYDNIPEAGHLSLPFGHGLRACPGKRFSEQSIYLAVVTVSFIFEQQ